MYHLLAVIVVCVWGTTFVSSKMLLHAGFSPSSIFALRFALAYVAMAAMCHTRVFCRTWRDEAAMAVAGVTGGSLYFLAENTALTFASAGSVSLIVCTAPLVTLLFASFLRGAQRPSVRTWLGSLAALGGVAFIVSDEAGAAATNPLLGGLLAAAGAALWAVYQLVVRPLSTRYGAFLLTRKVFGYGLLSIFLLHLFALPFGVPAFPDLLSADALARLSLPAVWGNLLFLGVVASWWCYLLWNKVVEHLGAVHSAAYIYLNPLSTCAFAALFLGERFTPAMGVGGAMVLVGLFLGSAPERLLPRLPRRLFLLLRAR